MLMCKASYTSSSVRGISLHYFQAVWLMTLWAKAEDMGCCVSFTLQSHQSVLYPVA